MEPPISPTLMKSPIIRKAVGIVDHKPTRSPTEVCLEDWWLSKPDNGKGIAVTGRPIEMRSCDYARREFHSAPTKKRYASRREFRSSEIIKRHGCTTIETSDGLIVSLCGFINRSRTRQNGFSSEVCRDFIYGFPYNWKDSAANCVGEKSSQNNHECFSECFLPAALDAYKGAQLHDLVLSLTDSERDVFNEKMYDNLMGVLSPETMDVDAQPSESNASSLVYGGSNSNMTKPSNKRQSNTRPEIVNVTTEASTEEGAVQKLGMDVVTPRKRACTSTAKNKNPEPEQNVNVSPKPSIKQEAMMKSSMHVLTPTKCVCTSMTKAKHTISGTEDVNVSPNPAIKQGTVDKLAVVQALGTPAMAGLATRDHVSKSVTHIKDSVSEAILNVSPEASVDQEPLDTAEVNICADQSEVRQLLERLTSAGQNLKGKGSRLCKELKNLLY